MKRFCAQKGRRDKQKSKSSVITFSFLSGAIYLAKLNFSGLCKVPIWITISLHGNCYNNFKFYY